MEIRILILSSVILGRIHKCLFFILLTTICNLNGFCQIKYIQYICLMHTSLHSLRSRILDGDDSTVVCLNDCVYIRCRILDTPGPRGVSHCICSEIATTMVFTI